MFSCSSYMQKFAFRVFWKGIVPWLKLKKIWNLLFLIFGATDVTPPRGVAIYNGQIMLILVYKTQMILPEYKSDADSFNLKNSY